MYNIKNMIEMFLTATWTEWEPWGSCDEEDGSQERRRACSPGCNDAITCLGPYEEDRPCCGAGTFFVLRKQKKVQNCISLFNYLEMFKLKFFAI